MNNLSIQRARWSVYVRVKGKLGRKKFGDDLPSALKFYHECLSRDLITVLHCDNLTIHPPARITHHPRIKYEIVRKQGKNFKRKITHHVNLMKEYNERGIWWCPYCIGLYRFQIRTDGRRKKMCCPICGISNEVFGVRQANPLAVVVEMHGRTRRSNGSRRKRRT